jgi:LPS export ABC transporter protein LptC
MPAGFAASPFQAFLLLVGWLAFLLTGCSEPPRTPEDYLAHRKGMPVSESFNVTYLYSDSARLEARLEAEHVTETPHPDEPRQTITHIDQGFVLRFYDAAEIEQSRLRAQRATIYERDGYAVAEGNVVVTNNQGDTLETETLYWYRARREIATNAFVKIKTPREILYGDSLVAGSDFSWYRVYKIRGTLVVEE